MMDDHGWKGRMQEKFRILVNSSHEGGEENKERIRVQASRTETVDATTKPTARLGICPV
jgi:hypothetical protein